MDGGINRTGIQAPIFTNINEIARDGMVTYSAVSPNGRGPRAAKQVKEGRKPLDFRSPATVGVRCSSRNQSEPIASRPREGSGSGSGEAEVPSRSRSHREAKGLTDRHSPGFLQSIEETMEKFEKCDNCSNLASLQLSQICGWNACGACCFGEADALQDYTDYFVHGAKTYTDKELANMGWSETKDYQP